MAKIWWLDRVWPVECERCGARRGQACKNHFGYHVPDHAARKRRDRAVEVLPNPPKPPTPAVDVLLGVFTLGLDIDFEGKPLDGFCTKLGNKC